MIHQIRDSKVGDRGVRGNDRIAIELEESLHLGDHARAFVRALVEHAAHRARDDRMRPGRNAARIGPAQRAGRIVLGSHDLLHRVVDRLPGIAKPRFESARESCLVRYKAGPGSFR